LDPGGECPKGFVWPGDAGAIAGIVGPPVQRAVQGASIQESRSHGTASMRAGIFDGMEAIL
jgi:hypothetical protein